RFKSIVENSPTGAVLTRELAELGGLPSSMIGTRLVHRPNGTHYFVGTDANGRPIQMQVGQGGYAEPVLTGPGGQAAGVYERPERPESVPYGSLRGAAEQQVAQAHGLKSLDDLVDNPAFTFAFQREKAADQASAQQYGYPAAS